MPDLVSLEQKLNQDSEFRRAFLLAPLTTLRDYGITVATEQSEPLQQLTERLRGSEPGRGRLNPLASINVGSIDVIKVPIDDA